MFMVITCQRHVWFINKATGWIVKLIPKRIEMIGKHVTVGKIMPKWKCQWILYNPISQLSFQVGRN